MNSSFPTVLVRALGHPESPVSQTIVLKGNPDRSGLYTIMLRIPANTRIAAHVHQ